MSDVVIIEKITAVIENKYEAVRVIAREARRINALLIRGEGEIEEKPTMMALQRVLDNKVKYSYVELDKKKDLFDGDTE